jgi:NADH dehydrogenase
MITGVSDDAAATRPRPRVVIVGGGFGGLTAAKALRSAPVDLLLIDRRNHHVFQPLLYQVATAALSPGDISAPIRWILRHQANSRVWMGEVASIDAAAKTLTLTDGTGVMFDYLIVSAGAAHAYFGHDEWRRWAPGLKTLEDALDIRRRVLLAFEKAERATDRAEERRLLTFVVVGGGPTGVELAGALAEISRHALAHDFRAIDPESARVILIEGGPTLLGTYPQELSDYARAKLERLGVNVWTRSIVTNVTDGRVYLGEEMIEAGTVLWAAGVSASPLGASLGVPLDRAGRVLVHPDLSVPGHPDIFVVGDLAALEDGRGGWLPGVAQVAIQQGRHAAANVRAKIAGQAPRPFRYRNLGSLATIGRNSAVADLPAWRSKGFVAWLFWLFVHVMNLVGFRNRLSVLTQWAFSYLTYQRSVRLITFDNGVPPAQDP